MNILERRALTKQMNQQREKKEPTKEGSHTKRLLGLERK